MFDSDTERQGDPLRKAYLAAFVEYLAREGRSKDLKVLEVGSWAGASAITWAKSIKELGLSGSVLCIDLWRPYFDLNINSTGIYREMTHAAETGQIRETFLRNLEQAGVSAMVEHIVGDSKDVLPRLEPGSFNIVFIDGSHSYSDVVSDIRNAMQLVTEGGILCGDDFELTLHQVSMEAHRTYLRSGADYAEDPRTGKSYHPGVTQALAESFERVAAWHGVWAVRRTGDTWNTFELSGIRLRVPDHLLREVSLRAELIGSHGGYNIVKYGEQALGLRQSLGTIDLSGGWDGLVEKYGPTDVIVCETVDGVRARIDHLELVSLVKNLARKVGAPEEGETNAPLLLGSYFGYNVVAYGTHVFGLSQTLGEIDVRVGGEELLEKFGPANVIICGTADGVRARIDYMSVSARLQDVEERLAAGRARKKGQH